MNNLALWCCQIFRIADTFEAGGELSVEAGVLEKGGNASGRISHHHMIKSYETMSNMGIEITVSISSFERTCRKISKILFVFFQCLLLSLLFSGHRKTDLSANATSDIIEQGRGIPKLKSWSLR